MRSFQAMLVVCLFVVVMSSPTFADKTGSKPQTQSAGVLLSVVPIAQPNSPLQISMLQKNLRDQIAGVTVQSNDERTVVSYQLGWVASVPSGCGGNDGSSAVTLAPIDEMVVLPHGTNFTSSYRLWAKDLMTSAMAQHAELIHVQVGVVFAKFSDGSVWSYDLAHEKIFDEGQLNLRGEFCSSGHAAELLAKVATENAFAAMAGTPSQFAGQSAVPQIRNCVLVCYHIGSGLNCTMQDNLCRMTACLPGGSCNNEECYEACGGA